MSESSERKLLSKKEWPLTAPAFRNLLAWLDECRDSQGQTYLEMRRRLVAYFDRKNCSAPDELADETLNRVARRLEEEGKIDTETPAKYCYTVARFVFMEHLRESDKANRAIDDVGRRLTGGSSDEQDDKERMLDCLDRCLGKLESPQRELVLRYYIGKERVKIENRRALAHELAVTVNALSIRACRIRDKLEGCVRDCVATK